MNVFITQAKAQLEKLITRAVRGEEIVICRWGKPVAFLEPGRAQKNNKRSALLVASGRDNNHEGCLPSSDQAGTPRTRIRGLTPFTLPFSPSAANSCGFFGLH